jgi:hypothetical protein
MLKIVYPKTKRELTEAIASSNIIKFEVFEASDSRITATLRHPKQTNTRRTVIIIDERI